MCKCENCGCEHDGSYGSGRFCSDFCARSFSSKHLLNRKKKSICPICGKEFCSDIRSSSNTQCPECKRNRLKSRVCSICGRNYYSDTGCENDFCKNHNISQIRTLIKYFGFDESKLGTEGVSSEFNRIRNILFDLYWNKHISTTEIAKMFGYPSAPNLSDKVFRGYMDIPVKSVGYSCSENYSEGRLNPVSTLNYMNGWHTTWNGKSVYLRSSYEFDYANELDEKKIDYDVESIRIPYFDSITGKQRCAIPDFYLPETNTIVEIKSNYTLDVQNMIDRKDSYIRNGYNFKLICEHKEMCI